MSTHRHAVLLVDDYAPFQEAAVFLLEAAGYTVARADSGADALAILRGGFRPCVMFLDTYMPGMDGADVLAAMAADPALSGIAVVRLSGANEIVARARRGMPAMLAKPVDPDALFAAVERYARCPRETASAASHARAKRGPSRVVRTRATGAHARFAHTAERHARLRGPRASR